MQIDFLNPRSIVVFVCILQGSVFAGLLIYRGKKTGSRADLWLAALLLLLCSSLITPFIGFANVYDANQWLTYFPFSVVYSYGVCIWFYTRSLTDGNYKVTGRRWLYFLPSAVYLAFRFVLFAQTVEWKGRFDDTYVRYFSPIIFVTELAWNTAFIYASIRHYRKYRNWLNDNFSDTEKVKFDWLRNFLYLFGAVMLIGAAFDVVDSFVVPLSYIQYFYFEVILAVATYYLAVSGYVRSRTINLSFDPEEETGSAEKRQVVSESDLSRLRDKLSAIMENDRPYLDASLTLNDLSKMMGVNTTVLSYVINQGCGCNFNDLVNRYRIDETKARIRESSGGQLLSIAFDCGFNSKATFNRAFKKFTGQSPSEYQSSLE